jgi:hypothetical protein
MTKLISRKFIVSLLVIGSADVLLALGQLNATVWGSTVGSVVALYVASNVAQKVGVKS